MPTEAELTTTPATVTGWSANEHVDEQNLDHDVKWIKNLVVTNEIRPTISTFENKERQAFYKQFDTLRIRNGILYRGIEDRNGFAQLQYVLSIHSLEKVLHNLHTTKYSGQFGFRKTFRLVNERFYLPFLKDEVKNYVRTCDTCQKIKAAGEPHQAELIPIIPSRTNELLAIDLAGPFKTTKRGNNYTVIMVDSQSKFMKFPAFKR